MSSTDSPVRLGIVGTNFISDLLCDAAKRAEIPLAAVFSRKRETGEDFAKKHGIPAVFDDFDDFCKSELFNAAYVASPNFCHFSQSAALLAAGKHVLCEKPITSNVSEFRALRDTALAHGKVLLEAMRPAYDPSFELIRSLLPRCGKLRRAMFEYSQYSSRYDRFKAGIMTNAFDPSLSNAAVMDIGVYPIHLCARLFGRPKKLLSHSVFLQNGFEGQGEAILDYGEMTAQVVYSKITEAAQPSFIRGEEGEIWFGKALSKVSSVSFVPRCGKPEPCDLVPPENNMVCELYAFCDCISGKRDFREELAVSEIAMEIIDEIRRQNAVRFPSDER